MKKKEELIWDYLDGQLDEADRARVEQAVENDQAFRALFLQSELLHNNLDRLEAEEPPMRFTQHVMDRLPAVKDLATGPLVSVRWLRSFYGSTFALLVLLVGSTLAWFPGSATAEDPMVERLLHTVNTVFSHLPNNMLLLTAIILISLLLLFPLDRWLQNRFQRS